jgi:hypothetical protein
MTNLRQLLITWETWSARDTMTRALGRTATAENGPTVSAVDALRDSVELVELLTSWQWQATYAARCERASWEEIGTITRTTAEGARPATSLSSTSRSPHSGGTYPSAGRFCEGEPKNAATQTLIGLTPRAVSRLRSTQGPVDDTTAAPR